ncbi:LapA family protein [Candidatus Bipolaricaulota bacterium]|nr:LapA family protein [Candidatus Bipolaricaulota bacterium]
MRARSVVIVVLLILSLTLVAQNTEVVQFRAWFWTLEMSRVLMLAGSIVIGVIIGLLLGRPWKRQKHAIVKKVEPSPPKPSSQDT